MITTINFILSFLEMLMIFSAIISIPVLAVILSYLFKDVLDLFMKKIIEISEKLFNR